MTADRRTVKLADLTPAEATLIRALLAQRPAPIVAVIRGASKPSPR
jgi:hypothetical protein